MPRTVIGYLARHAATRPASLVVAIGTTEITYGELWNRVRLVAELLRRERVEPGDRVMLAASRTPEFLYAYFACHVLHAIAVPYEPDTAPQRFQGIVELLHPRVNVGTRATPPAASGCTSLLLEANQLDLHDQANEFVEPDPGDHADILLTSGTTGTPKGVLLSHRNILASARNINQFIGNTADDREAVALPLSHSFGLGRVRCQILAGGALVLTRGFRFPKQMFEVMRTWRATGFSFVPTAWTMLSRLSGDKLAEFSPQFRYLEIGSAPLSRAEKERLMRLFPGTRICMHYGLTEASRSAFIEFHESSDRLDSIGRPTPNVAVRVVDELGCELGPRQVGRIQICGEHVTKGYWTTEPGERMHGTSLYSGDLGFRDEDGYLYLCGREDDVINVGGRKVHPTEVEQALLADERIEDAVCVGVSDVLTGQAVRAFLVAKAGGEQPDAGALGDFLLRRLEPYKIPVAFDWVSSIPRNASGKIDRKAVIARLEAAPRSDVEAQG